MCAQEQQLHAPPNSKWFTLSCSLFLMDLFFQVLTFFRNISTSHKVMFVTSRCGFYFKWLVIAFVNCVSLLLYHFLCLCHMSMTIVRDIHESMILCHGYEIFDIPINVCNLLNVLFYFHSKHSSLTLLLTKFLYEAINWTLL